MEKSINRQEIVSEVENCAENGYVFSPAIGKRKIIGGKTYFVRGVFKGGQDFETAMKKKEGKTNGKNGHIRRRTERAGKCMQADRSGTPERQNGHQPHVENQTADRTVWPLRRRLEI